MLRDLCFSTAYTNVLRKKDNRKYENRLAIVQKEEGFRLLLVVTVLTINLINDNTFWKGCPSTGLFLS